MRYDPFEGPPAPGDPPTGPGSHDEVMSGAEEFEVWEDEGGTIARFRSGIPGGRAKRHFDEVSG